MSVSRRSFLQALGLGAVGAGVASAASSAGLPWKSTGGIKHTGAICQVAPSEHFSFPAGTRMWFTEDHGPNCTEWKRIGPSADGLVIYEKV